MTYKAKNYLTIIHLILLYLGISTNGFGQSNNIKQKEKNSLNISKKEKEKKKLIALTGGVSLNFNYNPLPLSGNKKALNLSINGSPNLKIFKFSLPINLAFSNKKAILGQTFNRIGISPKYKWVKLHIGDRNMSFSKFTMAGRPFYGLGIELNPGVLRLAAMTGKLQRTFKVSIDSLFNLPNINPLYQRDAFAFKLGVGKVNNYFDLILFQGKDRYNSIKDNSIKEKALNPKDNTALGINSRIQLFKKFTFNIESGISLFSNNSLSDTIEVGNDYPIWLKKFYTPNNSTYARYAIEANLGLRLSKVNFKIGKTIIQQDYNTLAQSYISNDIDRWYLNPSFTILNNKLDFNINVGLQKNNTMEVKKLTTHNISKAINLSYYMNNSSNIQLNYSDFNATLSASPDYYIDPLDSLLNVNSSNLFQNLSINFNKSFNSKTINKNLSINSNFTRYEGSSNLNNRNFNLGANYSVSKKSEATGTHRQKSVNIDMNYYLQDTTVLIKGILGFNFSGPILKSKIGFQSNISGFVDKYSTVYSYGSTTRFSFNYKLNKKQNLTASAMGYLYRRARTFNNRLLFSFNYNLKF